MQNIILTKKATHGGIRQGSGAKIKSKQQFLNNLN